MAARPAATSASSHPHTAPERLESTMFRRQRAGHLADADRIGAGHRFDERREQVGFLVGMMIDGGAVEIANDAARRRLRLRVGAMASQMRPEAAQRGALLLDAVMAGRQHLERCLESSRGRPMPECAFVHFIPLSASEALP